MIEKEAEKIGIPPHLAYNIVQAESSGFPFAVGKNGERGLFQFTKPTWIALTNKPFWKAFIPSDNIQIAMLNFKDADTSDPKSLASYHNAGTKDWKKLNKKWTINHPNKIYRDIYNK